jgi:hypothetical protein
MFRLAADAIVAVHATFVVYVMLGGVLVLRWPRTAWAHVPAAIWGIAIEFGGWMCPLTPIENQLRQRGGSAGYEGDFIEHYLMPLLYPANLTRTWQLLLGSLALIVNAAVYWRLLRSAGRRGQFGPDDPRQS